MTRYAVLPLLALALLGPALAAGPIDAAYAAYQRGDLSGALAQYRKLAQRGDGLAQFNYAMMLKRGEGPGGGVDWFPWLQKAAEAGVMNAAYALGLVYENGDGVNRSQPDATRWFRAAAEKGHTQAQLSLGTQYFLGRGIERDYREAARWYEAAAEGGDMAAQYLIASMYEHGDGVEADRARALSWYAAAARQGDETAKLKAEALARGK
ncbi:tetratricopeptide repeat protein [Chitinimonas koreensis]|uniref:tetratricopeptide repeat protein n=1 Tax=Chitinimonas koreensis TaxID=356302 RepID=UPI00040462BA|nr:tetratricopeptide repeat protein [Chitinimonas koreensis]QNM95379.1 sel1 repeat family protein [Chitinimonas koreensis]